MATKRSSLPKNRGHCFVRCVYWVIGDSRERFCSTHAWKIARRDADILVMKMATVQTQQVVRHGRGEEAGETNRTDKLSTILLGFWGLEGSYSCVCYPLTTLKPLHRRPPRHQ